MNKVVLVGNLTRDPELNTTSSGISVCKFTVAVQRRFTNAEGSRETDFLPVIVWRGQAESCGKYLRKGSRVGISGSVQTRSYEAQDGTKRYTTEIIADEVEFISGNRDNADRDSNDIEGLEPPRISKPKSISELKPVDDDLPF